MKEYQAQLGNYTLGKKLGNGQFSKVRIGTKEGKQYAVKYLPKTNELALAKTCLALVENEVKIMLQLDNPSIVKLFEFGDNAKIVKTNGKELPVLYLVLELISGGELFDYIAAGGRFSDPIARFYVKELIKALEYLYSKGYAHRDIKAENILLDGEFNLKLADFGFSTLAQGKDGSGKLHTQKGTIGYMAPEIHLGQAYIGEKVDLFAVGVLAFTMVAGHPPIRKGTTQDPFYKAFCQQNAMFWKKVAGGKPPGVFSENFMSFINMLMAYNPEIRGNIAKVKAHPWFNEPTPTLAEVQTDFANRRYKVDMEMKAKAQEATLKKKAKNEKKAAFGGFAPHVACKGGAEEEKADESVKRILDEYKVKTHRNIY